MATTAKPRTTNDPSITCLLTPPPASCPGVTGVGIIDTLRLAPLAIQVRAMPTALAMPWARSRHQRTWSASSSSCDRSAHLGHSDPPSTLHRTPVPGAPAYPAGSPRSRETSTLGIGPKVRLRGTGGGTGSPDREPPSWSARRAEGVAPGLVDTVEVPGHESALGNRSASTATTASAPSTSHRRRQRPHHRRRRPRQPHRARRMTPAQDDRDGASSSKANGQPGPHPDRRS